MIISIRHKPVVYRIDFSKVRYVHFADKHMIINFMNDSKLKLAWHNFLIPKEKAKKEFISILTDFQDNSWFLTKGILEVSSHNPEVCELLINTNFIDGYCINPSGYVRGPANQLSINIFMTGDEAIDIRDKYMAFEVQSILSSMKFWDAEI